MEFENLPQNWEYIQIKDLAKINALSITKNFPFKEIEYLDTSSITENLFEQVIKLKIDDAPSRAKRILRKNDIVISTVRPNLKHYGFIQVEKPNLIGSTGFAVITTNTSISSPRYLYYYLTQEKITQYLSTIAESSTTTYPSFKPSLLEDMKVALPPLSQQQKTASILGALDDKIELNNQMNQTLETMAKALFKSWFVDFEPFADGEFEESELGMIPKGWKVGALEDITHIKNGFAFKSEDYTESGITVVRTKNFTDTGNVVFDDVVYLPESFFESHSNYQLQIFDLLLVMVGASVGKMAMVYSNTIPSLQNQNMWNFRAKQDTHQFYVIYIVKKVVDENLHTASGSAREFFRKDYFKSIKVVIPSDDIITKFTSIVKPIYDQINSNVCQIETLSTIRDSLLPKLMSGEIEV